ncbi:MAG TPA: prolyl oligopeptidase family serine peptidase [Flavobacterium sp.]|jgi:prolyl oligopeptidase
MKLFFQALFLSFSSILFAQQIPTAKKIPVTATRNKVTVTDNYSWLEETGSAESIAWIEAENAATASHLNAIRKTWSPVSKIKEYDFLSTNSLPARKGKYFYGLYRFDKDKPGTLCYKKSLNEPPIDLVDPSKLYNDDNASIDGIFPSESSTYVAFQVSTDGSDKKELRFVHVGSLRVLDDRITGVKYSGAEWNKNDGVFYKRTQTSSRFARDSTYQLFYHKIGDAVEKDALIFDTTNSQSSISFFTSENKLFITEVNREETSRNYYVADLNTWPIKLEKYLADETSGMVIREYYQGRMYFSTSDYDWGEIRSFDIKNQIDKKVVVPQIYTQLLVNSWIDQGYIFCKYKNGGNYCLRIYNIAGEFIRKFDLPHAMDFSFRFYDPATKDVYVSLYSYVISFQNFKLNVETGTADSYYSDFSPPKSTLFPLDYFVVRNITYKSRDNKDIPITIIHKKKIVLDGTNPTLLEAYGGFGVVSGPHFDSGLLYFLEKGGVFAYASIRGGGEKGLQWHNDGRRLKKINTFNDFIDAAEYLISEKYTSPAKLGITGASHGGLVVGAASVMRPDLFAVAIPVVGKFDMFKSDLFTVGKHHLDEYGNPDNPAEFAAMMAYSPYFNIKEDVNYPTMLIKTSEYDDRVPPFHSYKFAASLQNRSAQKNLIYLETARNSGHYGKSATYAQRVQDKADFYSFLLYHLTK